MKGLPELLEYSFYAAFASFGGILGHLFRTFHAEQPIHWGKAALEGASAGFVGLLTLLLCQAIGVSEEWTGVIVGLLGWMGANATVKVLELVVLKKLGIHQENKDDSVLPQ